MSLICCPECQRQISDRASACPQCGFPIRSATGAAVPSPPLPSDLVATMPRSLSPLREIAYRQKLLLYAVLVSLLTFLPVGALLESPQLSPIGVIVALANAIFSAWCFFKLGRALDVPLPLAVCITPLILIPGLSLLVMILLVGRATKSLKQAGVSVGLMGANLSKVP